MTDPRARGYLHEAYVEALREFGTPRRLPASGGWILEREIPGTRHRDAIVDEAEAGITRDDLHRASGPRTSRRGGISIPAATAWSRTGRSSRRRPRAPHDGSSLRPGPRLPTGTGVSLEEIAVVSRILEIVVRNAAEYRQRSLAAAGARGA